MKLYEWDFAPNCRRVRMFLLEKGIEVQREECITSDIILKNDYRDRYAHYMVPMLELDDGTQIGEALSIWHYFETLHPDPPLMGATPVEKAMISAWERRAYDEGMVGHAEIFRNSQFLVGPRISFRMASRVACRGRGALSREARSSRRQALARCPARHDRGWDLKRRGRAGNVRPAGRTTSVTAGTIMHRSCYEPAADGTSEDRHPAVHIVTSHSMVPPPCNSGHRAKRSCRRFRSCAVPWSIRIAACDLIEIDEATLPVRTAKDPATGGQGRSPQGKMRIAGAVELSPEGEPRRIRLAPIGDFSARSLRAFVAGTSAPGARVITDGWSGYCGLPDHDHQSKVVGATPAHLVLTWIHRVFSNLKRWALGTFHGLRRPICAATSTSSCSAGTAAATPQRLSTPCSASARACDPPTTATSSDNARLIPAGRAPATARPPIRLDRSRIPALQPA